jgi:hypothetical protein
MIFLLIPFPSCDLDRELAFAIPPVTAQAMPSRSRIAHMLPADDIAVPDSDQRHSAHFLGLLLPDISNASLQIALPLPNNPLLFFSLADQVMTLLFCSIEPHRIAELLLNISLRFFCWRFLASLLQSHSLCCQR